MIADLLPKYYVAHGTNPAYSIIRSMVTDGHEVAWMELSGTVIFDITGQGNTGEPFTVRALYCECDFTKGVGWIIYKGEVNGLDGPRNCMYRKKAIRTRHLELRQEYFTRFESDNFTHPTPLIKNIPEIIEDLIQKKKEGEFIEDGGGASYFGGYFYLQTVSAITDVPMQQLWPLIDEMVAQNKIGLDGAVVQPYREPSPPAWEESFRVGIDGWVGIASLPSHRKMDRVWKLEVLKPDGTPAFAQIPGLPLMHEFMFGADIDDVYSAEQKLKSLISKAKKDSRR